LGRYGGDLPEDGTAVWPADDQQGLTVNCPENYFCTPAVL
tara:strand:+ start:17034 stop:17153 length:120 start_codon:yes stop_codon:yes gene_type:complete